MSAKTILSLLFLAALSVVAVLGFRALPHRLEGAMAAGKVETLVAATALPRGTLLRVKDISWRAIAETAGSDQILRRSFGQEPGPAVNQQNPEVVYGAALRRGVEVGEPITRGMLVRPADREFLQVVLSPQARAIAIPVTTGGASTGILSPGDYVDVITSVRLNCEQIQLVALDFIVGFVVSSGNRVTKQHFFEERH